MGKDENDAKELSNSWVKSLDDHTKKLCGVEFCSRNLLDSAAGGTFMEITLGEATKLLTILWQITRNSIVKELLLVKKVNSIEEISSLSEKLMLL